MILGKVHNVGAFGAVSSCPAGYHSVSYEINWLDLTEAFRSKVVFERQNGALNETIVYSDDAIRPVFLLFFT